jgi:hypothetical protein
MSIETIVALAIAALVALLIDSYVGVSKMLG